jgi:hypothetical protein
VIACPQLLCAATPSRIANFSSPPALDPIAASSLT